MSNKKKAFIRALAEFLVGNDARNSIELQIGKESAKEWSRLRNASPLSGWATVEEAEEQLTGFLGGED